MSKTDTGAAWTRKILLAQHGILEELVSCEISLADTYELYSMALPSHAAFWRELSLEERDHAIAVGRLRTAIHDGYMFSNIGKFTTEATRATIARTVVAREAAQRGDLSMADASLMALKLEASLIEAHFYDVVTSDAPGFTEVAEEMVADIERHIREVSGELAQYAAPRHAPAPMAACA